ncbi:class I SAM-dependent methyltransferase [Streptomyces scabiei]|uniref:Tellurite resistance protein TehB n=1 Tax=Streptomyces scabiei TaxID=1930 RepID=A0A100JU24_STRSC|nr:class I SAM-dependent methyltransferase [Streptomyces scabiei]GAQ65686.1 tellurite resistance protein TehB [Streptomyces scabiei]
MNQPVSKASVHAFYADAIPRGRNTAENLQAATSERFNTLLESIGNGTPRTALDLGYGTGTYTIALGRAGFRVTAVDQISRDAILRRIGGDSDWAYRIDPRECLAENFAIDEDFGVIVAKDVLHYLARRDVESLLTSAVAHARGANYHYLEVFTGITRRSADGRPLRIEGEADYSPDSFREVIERIYDGWDLTLLWSEYAEQDSRTGRNCFEATRATVIAANRAA